VPLPALSTPNLLLAGLRRKGLVCVLWAFLQDTLHWTAQTSQVAYLTQLDDVRNYTFDNYTFDTFIGKVKDVFDWSHEFHRMTESHNVSGWKGPLWVI